MADRAALRCRVASSARAVRQLAFLPCLSAEPSSPALSTLSLSFPLPSPALSPNRHLPWPWPPLPPSEARASAAARAWLQLCSHASAGRARPRHIHCPTSQPADQAPELAPPAQFAGAAVARGWGSMLHLGTSRGHRRVRAALLVLRRRSTIADEPPTTVTDEPQCLLCFLIPSGTVY